MLEWQFYPKSVAIPKHLENVVEVFQKEHNQINSNNFQLHSNEVLDIVGGSLKSLGFTVEKSKRSEDKIHVPVLFGRNGRLEKSFEADAFNLETKTVIEVEAGRAVTNHQFLKDLFQACMMHEVDFLVISVRNIYRTSRDFEKVCSFMDTLYSSNRLKLPLKGILIIGY